MRAVMLMAGLALSTAAVAQRPLGPEAITDGNGPSEVVLDRDADPKSVPPASIYIDTTSRQPGVGHVGAAIDRLLGRTIAHRPVPAVFRVYFGGIREFFEEDLRRRLRGAGANWNLAAGKPRHGDYGSVVKVELATVIAASPVAAAFRNHGYTLKLDEIARLTVGDTPATRHLPGHIDEMWITAHRDAR